VTGAIPVPLSEIFCGLPLVELSAIEMENPWEKDPVLVGLKDTVSVQEAFGASVAGNRLQRSPGGELSENGALGCEML
jgi:hypothetical protein